MEKEVVESHEAGGIVFYDAIVYLGAPAIEQKKPVRVCGVSH